MILGIVGPICSGKDEAAALLKRRGFEMFSLGDILREEMAAKGIVVTREALQKFGNDLREREGAGAISERILARVKEGGNYLVQGFRNPAEIEAFRKRKDFVLVAIDSPQKVRYARMRMRGREQDPRTFEEFLALEKREFEGIGQRADGLRISDCMDLADATIFNDTTRGDFARKLGDFIEREARSFIK